MSNSMSEEQIEDTYHNGQCRLISLLRTVKFFKGSFDREELLFDDNRELTLP